MKGKDVRVIINELNIYSLLSSLEMPALGLAVLAVIPGILDEAVVGLGALAVFGILKFWRKNIETHKEKILEKLNNSFIAKEITLQEYNKAKIVLNSITVSR